jgi:hypothetical protein
MTYCLRYLGGLGSQATDKDLALGLCPPAKKSRQNRFDLTRFR